MVKFWNSKRFWAAVVSIGATIFSEQFGIEIDEATKAKIVALIVGALTVSDGMRAVGVKS